MFKQSAQPKLQLTPSQSLSKDTNVTDMGTLTKVEKSDSKTIEKRLKIEKITTPATVNFKRRLTFTQKKEVDAEKSFITCRYTRRRTQTTMGETVDSRIPLQIISDSEEYNLPEKILDEKLHKSKCFVKIQKISDIEQELRKYNTPKLLDEVVNKLNEKSMNENKNSMSLNEVKTDEVYYSSDCSQSSTKYEDNFKVNTPVVSITPISASSTGNDAASRFDREKYFYPRPGPSHLNYYETE